jgi:hypothetical protein
MKTIIGGVKSKSYKNSTKFFPIDINTKNKAKTLVLNSFDKLDNC